MDNTVKRIKVIKKQARVPASFLLWTKVEEKVCSTRELQSEDNGECRLKDFESMT